MTALPASPVDALCTPCLKCFRLNVSPLPSVNTNRLVNKYVDNSKRAGSDVKTNMNYTYIHKCGHIYLVLEKCCKMMLVVLFFSPAHTIARFTEEWVNSSTERCNRKPWNCYRYTWRLDRAEFACLFERFARLFLNISALRKNSLNRQSVMMLPTNSHTIACLRNSIIL